MKKAVVLFNPSSGRGKSLKNRSRIEACLKKNGLVYDLVVTLSEGHLRQLSRDVSRKYGIIIGVGGDTTFNIIASQILKASDRPVPKLGFIGTGSANDICRSLGMDGVKTLCQSILSGNTRRMDVGTLAVNGNPQEKIFLGSVSAGLGTVVNQAVEKFAKRHLLLARNRLSGQLLPAGMGIIKAFRKKIVPRSASLAVDGSGREITFSLLIFLNINHYANGLNLNPGGSVFDGRIDCLVIRTRSFFNTLGMLKRMKMNRSHSEEGIERISADRFVLFSDDPIDVQVDGEVLTGIKNCDISVRAGALQVYVPE